MSIRTRRSCCPPSRIKASAPFTGTACHFLVGLVVSTRGAKRKRVDDTFPIYSSVNP
jgi:hypothetical protein